MNDNLNKKIYKIHLKQLKNLDIIHNKLLICFSGIAGSGKTSLAKILEERYHGVRIRNDDIRKIISNLKQKNIDEILYNYLDWFFDNYNFKNNLIIMDSGIDRKYESVFSKFKGKGFKIFIIRLKISRKLSEKRITRMLGKLDDNYINNIDRWIKEWKDFGKKVKSDITLRLKDNMNLNRLFSKLDKFVSS